MELELEKGAKGLLLSVCAHWFEEWSVDGRSDYGTTAMLILTGSEQIFVEASDSSQESQPAPAQRIEPVQTS